MNPEVSLVDLVSPDPELQVPDDYLGVRACSLDLRVIFLAFARKSGSRNGSQHQGGKSERSKGFHVGTVGVQAFN